MDYIAIVLVGFSISFLAIGLSFPIANRIGLVDSPNERKQHQGSIPLIGGLGIFISVLVASKIFVASSQVLNLYLISTALLLFIGILDDKYDLSVRIRIVSQVIIASILIFGAELHLSSLGYILHWFDLQLGYLGIFVTIVAVIGSINAFNMVDGIDGLAGMLSLVTFSSIAFLLHHSNSEWVFLPLLFIAAILAYLCFNLRWPLTSLRKVFMGDAGSMLIGLTVVWLLVIGVEADSPAFSPVTALYLIAMPLMDMAAIMIRRVKKGQSPFKPDRDHLHHIFERAGFSRKQTLVRITLASANIALIGILGEMLNIAESVMFICFILLFGLYHRALAHSWITMKWLRRKDVEPETVEAEKTETV
ncbi:UDP-N-acetylglucosamine--undecaprenyl-phosphate N-acetylglucosaminephosphotransferase [Shewanella abyssi]|uniref:UDP-N-acetylglucosamine--undecaprenyl-phosphate N-acetylglucosaminephosphotransferase n=1 Tax=Shewanella abyssi TaxID=311789 RepID=UPI002010258D|nr:UDP-N-acetylglucosamine--undecaprenyl-phosphate N-acetylglucosaminephosphotransferase [Shewanella abyssi]MCL1049550.1 UDP-N-acetylglucosamine--undecaprenyl-phosphate N-acetylglucosaminephosphotransferase [Shewanella abyssi]